MSKGFWAVIAVIVIGLGAIFIATNQGGNGKNASVQPTNNVQGSTSTGVKLVEYGDFQCPYCGQFYPIVKQVVEQNKDKIQFQFRNLPLTQLHKNAFAAARAAEAAALQGKFWEMYNLLYENQDPNGQTGWVISDNPLGQYYDNYAKQIGLNVSQFDKDFASSAVNDKINADIQAFKNTGLEESTPTFILDGKQIHPTYDASSFQKAIDAEIKAKTGQ